MFENSLARRVRTSLTVRTSALRLKLRNLDGVSAVTFDRVRGRRPHALRPNPPAAMRISLFVAIAHWLPTEPSEAAGIPARIDLLATSLQSLLQIDAEDIIVAVLTTLPDRVAAELRDRRVSVDEVPLIDTASSADSLFSLPRRGRHVVAVQWLPRRRSKHGYYLTWGHKELFRRALRFPHVSHLIYLEDDIRVTPEAFAYWCRFRPLLASHGLLPGFVRFESYQGSRFVVDQTRRQNVKSRPRVQVSMPGSDDLSRTCFQLKNPYQAMYILDRELGLDHVRNSPARSPSRSKTVAWSASKMVRERAAIGPIFDLPPAGFRARNVVPATKVDGAFLLDQVCLVEHLAATYAPSSDTPHGKIRVEDLFTSDLTWDRESRTDWP